MRYAICFTPPPGDPLCHTGMQWLGRNSFSGEALDPPPVRGLDVHEIAFHTAVPRRYGFHGLLKAPFRLLEEADEPQLLRSLMRFAGSLDPFELPTLEIGRCGRSYSLLPAVPCADMDYLAAAVVQEFDRYRAPLTEAEIERADPDGLSAAQFANLHRWGHPYVLEEFRFHMPLTGPIGLPDMPRFEPVLKSVFAGVLERPVTVANIALFAEEGKGGPFRVHSLHPLGKIGLRRRA